MRFLLILICFAITPTLAIAANYKESMSFGKGDRCSFMCTAFRENAVGLCMRKGYAAGNALNCNCNEGIEHPTAYGDISCHGELTDKQYGNILKLDLAGARCSEMSAKYDYMINEKCRDKGFQSGNRISGIQCSEASNTGWAVSSVICEGRADDF